MKQLNRFYVSAVVVLGASLGILTHLFFAASSHIEHASYKGNYCTLEGADRPAALVTFRRWQLIDDTYEIVDIKLPRGISYKDIKRANLKHVRYDLAKYAGRTRKIAWLISPMPAKNYYFGKFENGRASASIINKYTENMAPGEYFYLLKGKPVRMHVSSAYGFIATPKGFGMGACWGTSVLGGLIDRANYWFKKRYGILLFIVLEKHPHSRKYETYRNINAGYGYAIWESPDLVWDYRFLVNPYVDAFIKSVKIKLFSTTGYKKAYQGKAIGGTVEIVYNSHNAGF